MKHVPHIIGNLTRCGKAISPDDEMAGIFETDCKACLEVIHGELKVKRSDISHAMVSVELRLKELEVSEMERWRWKGGE